MPEADILDWRPTRRDLIRAAPLLVGGAALASPLRAAGSGNLRIFVLGDWGRDGDHYQKRVASLMDHHAKRSGCDMVVTTGDNFYTFGVSSTHDAKWRTSYEDIYSPELRRRPWFPVAGNHDWGGNIWAQLDRTGSGAWHMPWLWYDVPGSRFGRPDVHLFLIDTTVWRQREKTLYRFCGQAIREQDVLRQKRWLEDALTASCASTKLVFGHHPIYTIEPDGRGKGLADLDVLLRKAGVTAYVCGHDHCLYHFRGPDLDYVCSGGGSEERPREQFVAQGVGPRLNLYLDRAGFAMFDIGPQATSFRFVDRDGRVTPAETIASRGNATGNCSGRMTIDPEVQRERASARAKTFLPCASLF